MARIPLEFGARMGGEQDRWGSVGGSDTVTERGSGLLGMDGESPISPDPAEQGSAGSRECQSGEALAGIGADTRQQSAVLSVRCHEAKMN